MPCWLVEVKLIFDALGLLFGLGICGVCSLCWDEFGHPLVRCVSEEIPGSWCVFRDDI